VGRAAAVRRYNPRMYDPQGLLELHRRTHLGTAKLLAHCAAFSADELARELPGCGYPSLIEQWRHIIGAEDYWLSVLRGDWDIPDHAAACQDVPELEARRAVVATQTADYLARASAAELSAPRELATWPEGRRRMLVPAFVIMRTLTHAFQHRGQVIAICRLLDQPCPSSDFPLEP
jgi:uncharacterized damage-inducible protein DinB